MHIAIFSVAYMYVLQDNKLHAFIAECFYRLLYVYIFCILIGNITIPLVVDECIVHEIQSIEMGFIAQSSGRVKPAAQRTLTLWLAVGILFFAVSGGPFGTELGVSQIGPFWFMIGLIIIPFVWSLPEAVICAELATAFPCDGSPAVWVLHAYGPMYSFLFGWFTILSTFVDTALYPALMVSYIWPTDADDPSDNLWLDFSHVWPRYMWKIAFSMALISIHLCGLRVVGSVSVALMVLALFPIGYFCVAAPFLNTNIVNTANWYGTVPNPNWGTGLQTLFWNLNYWDCIGPIAGRVVNPEKTIPQSVFYTFVLVMIIYIVPNLVAISLVKPGR